MTMTTPAGTGSRLADWGSPQSRLRVKHVADNAEKKKKRKKGVQLLRSR